MNKKNYYELEKSEEAKYREEYKKIIDKTKNKDVIMTTINMVSFVFFILSLVMIIYVLEIFIFEDKYSLEAIIGAFMFFMLANMFFCCVLYVNNLNFKRWLKIKYNIEY